MLLLLLLCAMATAQLPYFYDEFLGKMIVSEEKYPFLTPENAPDSVHVYPTDQQLELIENTAFERGSSKSNEGQLNGFWDWLTSHKWILGDYLKAEFGSEVINSTIVEPDSLPFDRIESDDYFKAMVIERGRFKPFLDEQFGPRLRQLAATEKKWLPAEKIINEIRDCDYEQYGRVTDSDFKYDKEKGGLMVNYKVVCKEVRDSYFVGLAIYRSDFTLRDIEHVETIRKTWSFLWLSFHSTEINHWFEKRYITRDQYETLHNFILYDFGKRFQEEYRDYINAPSEEVHYVSFIIMGLVVLLIIVVTVNIAHSVITRRRGRNIAQQEETDNESTAGLVVNDGSDVI